MGSLPQKGITQYAVSPYEQRAFAGAAHNAIFNSARRVSGQIAYVATPFLIVYWVYNWGKAKNGEFDSVCRVDV